MSNFSTCAIIWVHPKVVSQYINQFSINFHIEISNDTIKSLNCVMNKLVFNYPLWLASKFTYSFIAVEFCYLKKCRFPFLHVKTAHEYFRNIFIGP